MKDDTPIMAPIDPRRPPIYGPKDPSIPLITNRTQNTSTSSGTQTDNSKAVVPYTNTTGTDAGTQTDGAVGMGGFAINKIIPHKPDYEPLTETRTVRHTWEGYLSVNGISRTAQKDGVLNAFDLLLNHIYQPISCSFVAQTAANAPTFGLSTRQAPHRNSNAASANNPNSRIDFPRRMVGGTTEDTGVAAYNTPTYKNWYEKLYRFWTPIQSSYKVTVSFNQKNNSGTGLTNAASPMDFNGDILIGVYEESYVNSNQSDIKPYSMQTVASATNAVRTVNLGHKNLEKIKGIKWYTISPFSTTGEKTNSHTVTITGSWKPGQRLGSVRNLTDIKQWYSVGSSPDPMWVENNSFFFISNDYNTAFEPTSWVCVNVAIEMEWIIQYKDLKDKVKYLMEPTHGNDSVHLRYGIDDIQFPYPIESHRPTPYNPGVPTYSTT